MTDEGFLLTAINWLATTEVSLLTILALFAAYGMRELVGLWFKWRSRT